MDRIRLMWQFIVELTGRILRCCVKQPAVRVGGYVALGCGIKKPVGRKVAIQDIAESVE